MCLTSELHEEKADSESTKKGDHSCYEKTMVVRLEWAVLVRKKVNLLKDF